MKKIIKKHRAAAKAEKDAKVEKAQADSAVKKVKEEKK